MSSVEKRRREFADMLKRTEAETDRLGTIPAEVVLSEASAMIDEIAGER